MKVKEFIKLLPKGFKEEIGVHITEKMTDKMEGIQSLSTSCVVNPFCQARMKDGSY